MGSNPIGSANNQALTLRQSARSHFLSTIFGSFRRQSRTRISPGPTKHIPTLDGRCLHVLMPGQAHCLKCRAQLRYTGLERSRPFRLHFPSIAMWLIGAYLRIVFALGAACSWAKARLGTRPSTK